MQNEARQDKPEAVAGQCPVARPKIKLDMLQDIEKGLDRANKLVEATWRLTDKHVIGYLGHNCSVEMDNVKQYSHGDTATEQAKLAAGLAVIQGG